MFSQSLFAQLLRMLILLIITLIGVHHYPPLLNALAQHATSGGCHQQNTIHHDHTENHP
ncbi:hypothetical protein MHO82_01225 [Vibrio sp. Of7-15]|uniref:hypothetical protein n=1 Tax=Vibrio sp. Of7-15 TaxID=2724879 RepID=UPI001EF2A2C8|nr:hypothetical protein [Vibrio sp. Of7-15]MCG7495482.1 hypothetical protein [Vibrio sp. Of7-15]